MALTKHSSVEMEGHSANLMVRLTWMDGQDDRTFPPLGPVYNECFCGI